MGGEHLSILNCDPVISHMTNIFSRQGDQANQGVLQWVRWCLALSILQRWSIVISCMTCFPKRGLLWLSILSSVGPHLLLLTLRACELANCAWCDWHSPMVHVSSILHLFKLIVMRFFGYCFLAPIILLKENNFNNGGFLPGFLILRWRDVSFLLSGIPDRGIHSPIGTDSWSNGFVLSSPLHWCAPLQFNGDCDSVAQ